MKRLKICSVLLLVILFIHQSSLGQGMEITPVRFDFEVEPGQSQSRTLTIRNTTNKRASYTLYAGDWKLDEQGKVVRQNEGENLRSCANWVTFSPSLVELNANESKEVTVTLNVPTGESSTRWAMAYVTLKKEQEAPSADKQLAMGIEVRQAIGVFITQSPKSNQEVGAKLIDFQEITQPGNDARTFAVKTQNTGDKILTCNMYLVISDLQNATEEKLEPVQFKVLPSGVIETELKLDKKLDKGSYMVAAVLDYGPDHPLEGVQMQLDIK